MMSPDRHPQLDVNILDDHITKRVSFGSRQRSASDTNTVLILEDDNLSNLVSFNKFSTVHRAIVRIEDSDEGRGLLRI